MKKIIALFLIFVFCTSCSTKFSLQKRKYGKGFYFSSAKSTKGNSDLKIEEKKEERIASKVPPPRLIEYIELNEGSLTVMDKGDHLTPTSENNEKLGKQKPKQLQFTLSKSKQVKFTNKQTEILQKEKGVSILKILLGILLFLAGLYILGVGLAIIFLSAILFAGLADLSLLIVSSLGLIVMCVGVILCYFGFKLLV